MQVNQQSLDLSDNQISDISILEKLVNLLSLDLSDNQISDISFLAKLVNLQSLYLSDNQIRDISFLAKLVNLQSLDLSDNRISGFDDELLHCLPNLDELRLKGNSIQNVPEEICDEDNCIEDIKNYFKDKSKDITPLYESKLILVGNGRVGKTCLVKRLLDNTFNPYELSTHAIQLRKWQLSDLAKDTGLEKIQINIWDFGGQDIYHATHRLFMKTKALFILVWDKDTKEMPEQKETLSNGKIITYKNHSLLYWLSYIKTLSSNSPVILVQSKMGIHGRLTPPLSDEAKNEYNIYSTISIESSKSTGNGFKALQDSIEQIIAEQVQNSCTEIPTQWYNVRKKISSLQEENIKQIPLSQFEEICKGEGLDESSTQTLLKYLHNTGVFFYQQGLFNNQIVVDQRWAIDAVYTLFDRTGYYKRLPDKGQITGEDLQEVWRNHSLEEKELFIRFMEQCEICFELHKRDSTHEFIPFH